MRLTVSGKDNKTSYNFYVSGKSYLESAKMMITSRHYPGREVQTTLPLYMVLAFSVEFYLKAWLSHAGVSATRLKSKDFGHNILALYMETVNSHGLENFNGLAEIVALLHDDHYKMTYRYMPEGHEYRVAKDPKVLIGWINELDDRVDEFVGASASKGLPSGRYDVGRQ